jgi:hypothetical protein
MFVLPVTAFCCNEIPIIFQESFDDFTDFHRLILPKCWEKSNFLCKTLSLYKLLEKGSPISRLWQVGTQLLFFSFIVIKDLGDKYCRGE